MKKDLGIIFGLFLFIIALLIFGRSFTSLNFVGQQPFGETSVNSTNRDRVAISIRTLVIDAKVAKTAADRKQGLAKMDFLPLNQGLLFVFDKKGSYPFWMKDMRFAIDIVWIDEDKQVVDLSTNVPPEPGKRDRELTIYKPGSDVLYVLEVNAGLMSANSIEIGDKVIFEL